MAQKAIEWLKKIKIVYETDALMVINKPAGLSVHQGLGNFDNHLIAVLAYYYDQKNEKNNLLNNCLVHRIDKDTSGLMVVAKTANAFQILNKQFQDKTAKRIYWALVWGKMPENEGKIQAFVGRHPDNEMLITVSVDETFGKNALTHYRVLEEKKHFSLIRLVLQTGRTHQIRVHCSHIGNPLLGDKRYERFDKVTDLDLHHSIDRQALHAKTLGFMEPDSNEYLYFDSELADDLKALLI